MASLRIKQGNTFTVSAMVRDAAGLPLNLQAAVLSIALATAVGTAVEGLTIVADPTTPGQAQLFAAPEATAAWPVGILRCELTVVTGATTSTDTFLVYVEASLA